MSNLTPPENQTLKYLNALFRNDEFEFDLVESNPVAVLERLRGALAGRQALAVEEGPVLAVQVLDVEVFVFLDDGRVGEE